MTSLTVYRSGGVLIVIDIDEKTLYTQKLMGEHTIVADFYSDVVLPVQIKDYVIYGGVNFYVNRLPSFEKTGNNTFHYVIIFEGPYHTMADKLFRSSDGLCEFAITGKPVDFVNSIVINMLEIDSGWSVGTVTDKDEKNLFFSNLSCGGALTLVAETFKLEFQFIGKSISLIEAVGANTAHRFEYGRELGLYKLERQQVSDQNVVTRVYGYGSNLNIPASYRSNAKRLVFAEKFLEKNTGVFGIKEGQYTNNDIFPNRTGTLTNVVMDFSAGDLANQYSPEKSYIEDTSIDFDIKAYLMSDGTVPALVFKSGDLSGAEFDIWDYDHTTKRIYFNPSTDETNTTRPNIQNVPHIGDKYTLINLILPQTYVDTAEAALRVETQKFLDENSVPMVVYTAEIDPRYAEDMAVSLIAGDKVTIVDSQFGINSLIRVASIEFPLVSPFSIKILIADSVPYTFQEKVIKTEIANRQEAIYIDRTFIELTRRNSVRQAQLKDLIFDTDNYFDAVRIKPLSIETMMLTVGAKSTDFQLNGVMIKPNYLSNPNRLYVSNGELYHNKISVNGNYTWLIDSSIDQSGLDPNKAYYLYCRCGAYSNVGSWVITDEKLAFDSEAGFYHFLCGILYVVMEGWRDFDFTYGMTYINGRTITTGRIRSVNGLNFFDLDQNSFHLGDSNSSLDWSNGKLTIKGALSQSPSGVETAIGCFRGTYNPSFTYYKGDQVFYGGSTWQWINVVPGNVIPVEGTRWTMITQAGTNGVDGNFVEYQYAENGSSTNPPTINVNSLNPVGWSITPPVTGVLHYLWATKATKNYAGTILIGSWSTPVRLKGDSGSDGLNGTNGTSPIGSFRGTYNGASTYYGTSKRVDIVKYGGEYYIARTDAPGGTFSGHVPTDTDYWNTPSAQFESIATGLLLAELAYIDNLGVRNYQGTPVSEAGDLGGSVSNTVANSPDYYDIVLDGTTGSAWISVSTVTGQASFSGSLQTTAQNFAQGYYAAFQAIGLTLSYLGGAEIRFVGSMPSAPTVINASGNLHANSITKTISGTKQKDTITLTGSSGQATIVCDGGSYDATYNEDGLPDTALDFDNAYSVALSAGGVVCTHSGNTIILEAAVAGVAFSGATVIANKPNEYRGGVTIQRNHIWENTVDDDTNGTILINFYGYEKGTTRNRNLFIGDGKGNIIAAFRGMGSLPHGIMEIRASQVSMSNLPSSAAVTPQGQLYTTGDGVIRIKVN